MINSSLQLKNLLLAQLKHEYYSPHIMGNFWLLYPN